MRRWDRLMEVYLERYVVRGVSEDRVKQVTRELDKFGSWLKHRKPKPKLEDVGADLITRYLEGRCAFKAKRTLAGVMGVLRGMGDHLVEEGVWQQNPLRWMRGPKIDPRGRSPRRIGRKAMEQLWEQAATSRQSYRRYLWLAVLGLLYGTGLRRGELQRLNVSAWDGEQGLLTIDGRKTGWQRKAVVPELTVRCLEAYLPQRQNHLEQIGGVEATQQQALLVNQCGERMSPLAISRGVQRLAERAGIGKVTLHQFRHSCASDLLEAGVRLPEVQKVLGHRTIETTVRYLHIADPTRHEAVAMHPINTMLTGKEGAA